jgi:inner membrane transporter RhtA
MGSRESGRAQPLARSAAPSVPPTILVLGAVVSVQCGSAVATHLFATIGSGGAAFLRLAVGALVLLAVWRPWVRRHTRSEWVAAILFGLTTAAMNVSFYSALDRIPLGVAVTLEFVGPLGLAVAGSRRILDVVWVIFAAAGILLLAPWGGLHLDPLGIGFALLAGAFWSLYIILSARVGRLFSGGGGLAIAMAAGAAALLPVGLVSAGAALLDGRTLLLGLIIGLLSSVIPYSLEMESLRRLPTRVFGVLMSTEPVVGALAGLIFLGQLLDFRALVAILLVTVAAVGATRSRAAAPVI